MAGMVDRLQLTRRLVERHGWPVVNALVASGLLEWLEQQEGPLTQTAIAAALRQRLPLAVVLRAGALAAATGRRAGASLRGLRLPLIGGGPVGLGGTA